MTAFFGIILFLLLLIIIGRSIRLEPPEVVAGKQGEAVAANAIAGILRDDDRMFTNVEVSYGDMRTELDVVVVNKNGVFVIEVKNYSGCLSGSESDYEWEKHHTSRGGNTYVKTVKNPIRQVKRQVHILAGYLRSFGIQVWVEGYVFFLQTESPVHSDLVLRNLNEIDLAVHSPQKQRLSENTILTIAEKLSA